MRFRRRIITIAIASLLAYGFFGPYEHVCFNCGAIRLWHIIVTSNRISKGVRVIRGAPCDHKWLWQSSMMGCVDGLAINRIPIHYHPTLRVLESLPNTTWQKQLLACMTDQRNRLKWTIPLVLHELFWSCDLMMESSREWDEWQKTFAPMFEPEYDLNRARVKAQTLSDAFLSRYADSDATTSPFYRLLEDLELNSYNTTLFKDASPSTVDRPAP